MIHPKAREEEKKAALLSRLKDVSLSYSVECEGRNRPGTRSIWLPSQQELHEEGADVGGSPQH